MILKLNLNGFDDGSNSLHNDVRPRNNQLHLLSNDIEYDFMVYMFTTSPSSLVGERGEHTEISLSATA